MTVWQNDLRSARTDAGSRVDEQTGVTEQVEFFGTGDERLFGSRYVPAGPVRGGLVVCTSLHAEMLNAYRREVLFARALARRGFAVQRFHYRGHGHSDGASSEATFARMVEDTIAAVDQLRSTTGVVAPGFLGTRFGALVAAAAAARYPGAPLILWDPLMEGRRFFTEAFRASMVSDLKEQRQTHRSANTRLEELRSVGVVDVLGYPIDRALYDSSMSRRLVDELGNVARPIFIGQIGRAAEPRAEYRAAAEGWTSRGFRVHTEVVRQGEITWFLSNERRLQESRQPLADASARWLDEVADMSA